RQRPEAGHRLGQRSERGADIGLAAVDRATQLSKRLRHGFAGRRVHGVEDVVDLDRLTGLRLWNGAAARQVRLVASLPPDELDELLTLRPLGANRRPPVVAQGDVRL